MANSNGDDGIGNDNGRNIFNNKQFLKRKLKQQFQFLNEFCATNEY